MTLSGYVQKNKLWTIPGWFCRMMIMIHDGQIGSPSPLLCQAACSSAMVLELGPTAPGMHWLKCRPCCDWHLEPSCFGMSLSGVWRLWRLWHEEKDKSGDYHPTILKNTSIQIQSNTCICTHTKTPWYVWVCLSPRAQPWGLHPKVGWVRATIAALWWSQCNLRAAIGKNGCRICRI